jgi:RNA polymerase sigma-70 factor, ECF subfamily
MAPRGVPFGPQEPQMAEPSDTDLDLLLARLAEGDRSAFTPVFERLWPPTLRFCASILKNDADAADAAQQAMEKILVRASDYDPKRAALPWALAIASWECRTILRRRTRRREAPGDLVAEVVPEGLVDDDYVRRELVAAALTALGSMSETDQETLIATFREEAASVSGATLRKRRERAVRRLRDAFRRLYGLE